MQLYFALRKLKVGERVTQQSHSMSEAVRTLKPWSPDFQDTCESKQGKGHTWPFLLQDDNAQGRGDEQELFPFNI